ncbi:hypothetical protein L3Q72_06130 [Vibrio sp. JC009]|nr:hypothetical protein [Vibrio sp. JC009]WED22969.1 hypothetical protein L3Q72_06130 [Vibrio sp. JC009]
MKNRLLISLITTILTIQLSGCGTILHPERKGQKSRQIDPAGDYSL